MSPARHRFFARRTFHGNLLVCHVDTQGVAPQGSRALLEAVTDSGTPVRQWVPLR